MVPLALFGLTACPGTDPDVDSDPIDPGCSGLDWCAQGSASVALSCVDVDGVPYSITTTLSGQTDAVSCSVSGSDLDLDIGAPQGTPANGVHWVRFRMNNYTGEGTYPLTRTGDQDIDHGFQISGATAGGHMTDELTGTAGTWACGPSPCQAIVAPESDAIPNGDSVTAFRLRVEIQCEAGGSLWWHPECGDTQCSFNSAPSISYDVQCTN